MRAYDHSEMAANRELSDDEISSVLANKRAFLKDSAKVLHFIGRAQATVRIAQRRLDGLRDSLEKMEIQRSDNSDPIANALEALRTLTPEQKSQVLDYHVQERLAGVEKAHQDAQRAQTGAMSEANKARFVLAKLSSDSRLDAHAQEIVKTALAGMPAITKFTPSEPVSILPPQPVRSIPQDMLPGAVARRETPIQDNAIPDAFRNPAALESAKEVDTSSADELGSLFD